MNIESRNTLTIKTLNMPHEKITVISRQVNKSSSKN